MLKVCSAENDNYPIACSVWNDFILAVLWTRMSCGRVCGSWLCGSFRLQGLMHLHSRNPSSENVLLSNKLKTQLTQIRRYAWDAKGLVLELYQDMVRALSVSDSKSNVWFGCQRAYAGLSSGHSRRILCVWPKNWNAWFQSLSLKYCRAWWGRTLCTEIRSLKSGSMDKQSLLKTLLYSWRCCQDLRFTSFQ